MTKDPAATPWAGRTPPDWLAGRALGLQDHAKAPKAVVLNETAARRIFGAGDVVGQRFRPFGTDVDVVGVARDAKYDSGRKPVVATMFLPYAQTAGILQSMNVAVRTALPPAALIDALRAAVAEVDPDVPVTELTTQAAQIDESLGTEIALSRLLVAFGLFALFLACIGLHGVTAYSVARRTSEIGVRIAFGAQLGDVVWLVLRQVVIITGSGLAVGIHAALALTPLVRSFLYGVEPADPLSLAAAAVIMAAVAGVAGFLPARRASRFDPLIALRYE